jgi:flap endonuclease-1
LGVKLGGLVEAKKISLEDLGGRKIAIDGHNILYQFLAIIRGRQGEPLRDQKGRVTSHLSGLIYRNSNLLEAGIQIVYVFDGKPHEFKKSVLQKRTQVRRKAQVQYEAAVKNGRTDDARKFAQRAATVNTDIISDAKKLLTLMGIPWVQAPGEGEAQASYMAKKRDVWATASQDFDSLLYGTPIFIRNLSITGRRKLPRKNVYIRIEPEKIELNRFLDTLKINAEQLIDVGILVGTDYNPKGIKGIGPKTALKLVAEHGSLEASIPHIKNADFPYPPQEIKEIFLTPMTTDNYELEWNPPDKKGVLDFLCGERSFDRNRVLKALEKIEKGFQRGKERTTLDQYFRLKQ